MVLDGWQTGTTRWSFAQERPTDYTVTLDNLPAAALQAECELDITTEAGKIVAALTPQSVPVPAGEQATVTFAWDGVAPAGLYQAVAAMEPSGYALRSQARLLDVVGGANTYLPMMLKS
jgi:hypothetical protein